LWGILNKIIYDAIYASLPGDCKLTFAQMFCNFDARHHYMLTAKKMTSKSTSSIFSPTQNVLNGGASRTVNHLKWKYIDAIKSRVQEAIVLIFGRLPKKYWPVQHQEALQMAREHILRTGERVVEFTLEIVTCDHFSSLCLGRDYSLKCKRHSRRVRVGSSREGP
jgi:hypothetical protein